MNPWIQSNEEKIRRSHWSKFQNATPKGGDKPNQDEKLKIVTPMTSLVDDLFQQSPVAHEQIRRRPHHPVHQRSSVKEIKGCRMCRCNPIYSQARLA